MLKKHVDFGDVGEQEHLFGLGRHAVECGRALAFGSLGVSKVIAAGFAGLGSAGFLLAFLGAITRLAFRKRCATNHAGRSGMQAIMRSGPLRKT